MVSFAGLGPARRGQARLGGARSDKAGHGRGVMALSTGQGTAGLGWLRRGQTWPGLVGWGWAG